MTTTYKKQPRLLCMCCGEHRFFKHFAEELSNPSKMANDCNFCVNADAIRMRKNRLNRKNRPARTKSKVTETHKECSKCHEMKLHEDFYRNAATSYGLQAQCKPCQTESVINNIKSPEGKARHNKAVRKYMKKNRLYYNKYQRDRARKSCAAVDPEYIVQLARARGVVYSIAELRANPNLVEEYQKSIFQQRKVTKMVSELK
jgi:hypothetical protein